MARLFKPAGKMFYSRPNYYQFMRRSVKLLSSEQEFRTNRLLGTRLRMANFPYSKTLAQFDFAFQPSVEERTVRELQTLRFVSECSNVILLGPPGVGKTHLSIGLGIEAIRGGFGAYFVTAHDLVTALGKAAREGRLQQRMRVYLRPKVVVIDEVGYLPLDPIGAKKTAAYRKRQEQRTVILDRVSAEGLQEDLGRLMAAVDSACVGGDPLALSLDTVSRQDLLVSLARYFEGKSLPDSEYDVPPAKAQKGKRRSG